ncbi:FMN-dependent NADH-azoreductase [Streptomyces sp. NPDC101149]|uniref:FMN-dependent NADH-azoreductase n=1 Tax=Streptomyces sp. NPDC101149 TaxID=3366113 RepID=UPI003826CCD4
MSYLLRIDSSASGEASYSRQVADTFAKDWGGEVITRDLARNPLSHLDSVSITARTTPADQQTPEQRAAAELEDDLIEEFLGASAYLFAVPMYNYSMPSVFKAWLDHIMIPGKTFGMGDADPASGRPAVLVSARGGGYGPGSPQHGKDFLVPALEIILGDALGLDVRTITPELTYAPIMDPLKHLLPLHETSLAEAHDLARRNAADLNRVLTCSVRTEN